MFYFKAAKKFKLNTHTHTVSMELDEVISQRPFQGVEVLKLYETNEPLPNGRGWQGNDKEGQDLLCCTLHHRNCRVSSTGSGRKKRKRWKNECYREGVFCSLFVVGFLFYFLIFKRTCPKTKRVFRRGLDAARRQTEVGLKDNGRPRSSTVRICPQRCL